MIFFVHDSLLRQSRAVKNTSLCRPNIAFVYDKLLKQGLMINAPDFFAGCKGGVIFASDDDIEGCSTYGKDSADIVDINPEVLSHFPNNYLIVPYTQNIDHGLLLQEATELISKYLLSQMPERTIQCDMQEKLVYAMYQTLYGKRGMSSALIEYVKSFLTLESGEWDWRNGEWDKLKPLMLTEYIASSTSIVELNPDSIVIEEESKADYIEPKIISSRDLVSYEVIAKAIAIVVGNLQNDSKEGMLLNQAMTIIVQNTNHKYLEDKVLLKLQTTKLGSELHDLLINNESEIAIGLEFSPEIIAQRINTNLAHKEFGLENLLSLMMLINDILSSYHSSIKTPLEEAIIELYVRLHPESGASPSRYSCDDKYFDEDPDAPTPDGGGAGSGFAEHAFELGMMGMSNPIEALS